MQMKCYNKELGSGKTPRKEYVMKKGAIIMVLAFVVMAGCEPNEISFYVEHVKQQPESPECSVTESDGFAAWGTLDLVFRNSYSGTYLVTNQLMAREDYGNGVAESNGINIDGIETYTRGFDGALLSNTEYYEFELYVEPESSSIAAGIMVSATLADDLAEQIGCPTYTELEQGATIGQELSLFHSGVYSVVRFLGHSSGGVDVMTPEFTFPVNICCGCLIDWSNCASNCSKYCEDPEPNTWCWAGVDNGGNAYDCRYLYHNTAQTWVADEGETCQYLYACNCADDCELN